MVSNPLTAECEGPEWQWLSLLSSRLLGSLQLRWKPVEAGSWVPTAEQMGCPAQEFQSGEFHSFHLAEYPGHLHYLSLAQTFRFKERLGIMLVYPSEWLQKNCSCSIVAVRKTFARFHGCIGEIVQSMWLQEAVWRELFPGFQFNIQHLMQKGLLVCCKAHSCIRCSLLLLLLPALVEITFPKGEEYLLLTTY